MAIRRRQVQPGETGIVEFDDLVREVVNALGVQDFAGGVVSIVVDRMPTNLQGEMVTVGAVVEWRDRTDAKAAPEPATTKTEPFVLHSEQFDVEPKSTVAEDIDYSTLPEEDVDPLPEPAAS